MKQVHRDAIIIGGGPAGLAAAIALRQRGLDVLVAEALTPPLDKACGEGLMPDSRRALALLGVPLDARDGREFAGIHFAGDGSPKPAGGARLSVTAPFPNGQGLGVRRPLLHARMVDRAQQLGVQFAWGARVELRDGQPLRIDGETAHYGYLVGADGQTSRVRQWAGLGNGQLISRRFGFRRHYKIQPWSRNVEVHWGRLGQAYITPVGDDEICVAAMTRAPGISMEDVLAGLPSVGERFAGGAPSSRLRGAITTTRRLDRVTTSQPATGHVALVGDASGSADAVTGEGMAVSFRQALLLAGAIEAGSLQGYEAGHAAILRMPQTMSRIMLLMDRWPVFRRRALRMLAANPPLFAAMLGVHLGEGSIQSLLLRRGWQVALGLALPSAAFTTQGPASPE